MKELKDSDNQHKVHYAENSFCRWPCENDVIKWLEVWKQGKNSRRAFYAFTEKRTISLVISNYVNVFIFVQSSYLTFGINCSLLKLL